MKRALGRNALRQARVNVPGTMEEISWSLYDFVTYAAAGQILSTFFQTTAGKTTVDTNMTLPGQLPAGQAFLVTGISFEFQPATAPSQAASNLAANDVYAVSNSGFVQFKIGSKFYAQNSPLGLFPPTYGLDGWGATAVGATQLNHSYARIAGTPHSIIPVELTANQNFDVTVSWPTAVALPSAVAGRLGCRLHGRLFRNAQ